MRPAFGSDAQLVGILWMLKLDAVPSVRPLSLAPAVAVTFRRIGPEAALSLSQSMGLADPAVVQHRFATGRRCYAGYVEGKIAVYGWVTFDEERIGEIGLSIRMRAGEAYIWDCATLPPYRGQRLYPALLACMLDDLSARGLRRIWIGTDIDNVASQKGVALVGFQPIIGIGITRTVAGHSLWARKQTGASEQDALDARQMLLGPLEVR
jgi:ribosomal protein S18 acetylase RimI-like enzyme